MKEVVDITNAPIERRVGKTISTQHEIHNISFITNIKPLVYIINGVGGSGKSSFVSLCKEICPIVEEISTVDFVKQVAKFAGWDEVKDDRGRRFLADIKDAMDAYDNLSWKNVDKVIEEDPNYIYFINARSNYDIDYFKQRWNAKTILIERPGTPLIFSNHADAGVYDYKYDIVIKNNGNFDDFKNKAKSFLISEKILY